MGYGIAPKVATALPALLVALSACTPAYGQSGKVRITQLTDVAFGFVTGPAGRRISQNLCVFADTSNGAYSVVASGSGASGAFELNSGLDRLPFEVQWSETPGQSGGTMLSAGVTSPAFISNAAQQTCKSGPSTSATLTLVLRAAQVDQVTAGSYSGSLQIMIVPN